PDFADALRDLAAARDTPPLAHGRAARARAPPVLRHRGLRGVPLDRSRADHHPAFRDGQARADRLRGDGPGPQMEPARRGGARRVAAGAGDRARRLHGDDPAGPRHDADSHRVRVPAVVRCRGQAQVPGRLRRRERGGGTGSDLQRGLPADQVPLVPPPERGSAGRGVPAEAVADRPGVRRLVRRRTRREPPEMDVRSERAHGLHLLDPRRGARARRRAGRSPGLQRVALLGDPHRRPGAGRLWATARGGHRLLVRTADPPEPGRGHRVAAHHRRSAPDALVRGLVARGVVGGGRHPGERRPWPGAGGSAGPTAREPSMRVLIAGGGTAGHVFPALALARRLAASHGAEVHFAGTAGGQEATLVPEAGFPFTTVEARPLLRKVSVRALSAPMSALASVVRCRPLVEGSDVVVGMGGYVSVPVAVAAIQARRPLVLHEQNAVPGLANRALARAARTVALSFVEAERMLPRSARTILTGNPVRERILAVPSEREVLAKEAREDLGLEAGRKTVLIVGGSQGALNLCRATVDALEPLRG